MENKEKILLAHGSGGSLMHDLIEKLFKKSFGNEILNELSDSALIKSLPAEGHDLCFTTDSYTVSPLFFPGGDIGKLAVCGTINDLAVMGAQPLYLSCAFLIEEGLDYDILERLTKSIAQTARQEKVKIATGDFKVVEKNNLDKLFINTSGIGIRHAGVKIHKETIAPGDKIIINGSIGEHGLAILAARGDFDFQSTINSDCASLSGMIAKIIQVSRGIKFMRDPTRGGLATTLNEIVLGSNFGIRIFENNIPIKEEVRAACEILGFDPLYIANEGKVVVIVAEKDVEVILDVMRRDALGGESQIIGKVVKEPKQKVLLQTRIAGTRILDMLTAEQFPRIC
ncbi:MAG: hydrogenase expression/formation protein HypE [Candidatus Omnitrophica bacterium]|nr:hydrogenase expression/formation protein HypE [Candidatus Omnitrophota bacterium]